MTVTRKDNAYPSETRRKKIMREKFTYNVIDTWKDNSLVFSGTVKEVAEYLHMSKDHIYNCARDKKLCCRRYSIKRANGENIKRGAIYVVYRIDNIPNLKIECIGTMTKIARHMGLTRQTIFNAIEHKGTLKKKYRIVSTNKAKSKYDDKYTEYDDITNGKLFEMLFGVSIWDAVKDFTDDWEALNDNAIEEWESKKVAI